MTPAQKKGLVIGKQYTYTDTAYGLKGSTVTFMRDDGTGAPEFKISVPCHSAWGLDNDRLYLSLDFIEDVPRGRPFKKGDVVKLVDEKEGCFDIDTFRSYTLTEDEYNYEGANGTPVIEFQDNKGKDRSRAASAYVLVSRPGEKVASLVPTLATEDQPAQRQMYYIEAKVNIVYEAKEGETEADVRAFIEKQIDVELYPIHGILSVSRAVKKEGE